MVIETYDDRRVYICDDCGCEITDCGFMSREAEVHLCDECRLKREDGVAE